MSSTIIIKNSSTPGGSPSSLTQGEIAINVTDGKLFYWKWIHQHCKRIIYRSYALTASYALNAGGGGSGGTDLGLVQAMVSRITKYFLIYLTIK
jgi:hypothetical protein